MTLGLMSPDALTVSGPPAASSTTSEHVASNPRPLTAEGGIAASAIAARTEAAQAAHISEEDCSTTPPASCQTVIGCRATASNAPFSSKMPARALDVPTSMPMKACLIATPLEIATHSPARIASVDNHDTAGHQACGFRGQEQDHRGDLLDLSHPAHRCTTDPGIVHPGIVLDEGIKGGRDVGGRHGVDTDAPGAPLGRERFGEMVHRGLGGVVIALLLRLVDDEAGHRADIHDRDRKSTRLNSSHQIISYAVFCLKKKINHAMARAVQLDPC